MTDRFDDLIRAAEPIAAAFHAAYERLAPSHGYATRKESAVAWSDVPDNNKSLMIETVMALLEDGTIGVVRSEGAETALDQRAIDQDRTLPALDQRAIDQDRAEVEAMMAAAGRGEATGEAMSPRPTLPGWWTYGTGSRTYRIDGVGIEVGSAEIRLGGRGGICHGHQGRLEAIPWWPSEALASKNDWYPRPDSVAGWAVSVPTRGNGQVVALFVSGLATLEEAVRLVDAIYPPPSWVRVEAP